MFFSWFTVSFVYVTEYFVKCTTGIKNINKFNKLFSKDLGCAVFIIKWENWMYETHHKLFYQTKLIQEVISVPENVANKFFNLSQWVECTES